MISQVESNLRGSLFRSKVHQAHLTAYGSGPPSRIKFMTAVDFRQHRSVIRVELFFADFGDSAASRRRTCLLGARDDACAKECALPPQAHLPSSLSLRSPAMPPKPPLPYCAGLDSGDSRRTYSKELISQRKFSLPFTCH